MKNNKKGIKKTILLSALAAIAFGSVAVTTSYALFTSNAETTVTVTSGKVLVTNEIKEVELYSPTLIDIDGKITDDTNNATESTFACGGKVTANGNALTIDKMVAGDKVTATFTVKNESTVAIKYRARVELPEGSELKTTITGLNDKWTKLNAGETITDSEIKLVIELPTTSTAQFEETKTIKLVVEAVQGNADVADEVTVTGTTDEEKKESFENAQKSIESGSKTIVNLPEGEYTLDGSALSDSQGEGKTIEISGKSTEDTKIDLTQASQPHNATISMENVTVEGGNKEYIGYQHANEIYYKNCVLTGTQTLYAKATFENCTFKVTGDNYAIWTYSSKDVSFINCTFETGGKAILVYNEYKDISFENDIKLTKCTFKDDGSADKTKDGKTETAGKAAVETGSNENNTETSNKYHLTFTSCTIEDNAFEINSKGINTNSKLFGNKNSMDASHLFVTIDGNKVYGN